MNANLQDENGLEILQKLYPFEMTNVQYTVHRVYVFALCVFVRL